MATAKKLTTPHQDQSFAKGEVLLREGESSGDLWILRTGTVEIYRERAGKRLVLGQVGAGEMLGTMTATTGASRSASAVAVTDVTVTVVPKEQVQKLIAGLPGWAHSFIKDLVARVNYANDLYIEHELAHSPDGGSPLDLTLKIFRAWPVLGEGLAKDVAGDRVVTMAASLKALALAVGSEAGVKAHLDLFERHGLVRFVGEGDNRSTSLLSIHSLSLLIGLFETAVKDQEPGKPIALPLAQGERKLLADIAALGRGVAGSDDRIIMPLADVEDALRKQGNEMNVEALLRARRLGILELDKAAKPPSLSFDPHWVTLCVSALNLMRELVQGPGEAAGRDKKTLLY